MQTIIENSLILLDVFIIRLLIILVLIIYNGILIPSFNNVVSQWFRWYWFKVFYLFIITYVAIKDKTIALLLAISYVLSIIHLELKDNNKSILFKKRKKKKVRFSSILKNRI